MCKKVHGALRLGAATSATSPPSRNTRFGGGIHLGPGGINYFQKRRLRAFLKSAVSTGKALIVSCTATL